MRRRFEAAVGYTRMDFDLEVLAGDRGRRHRSSTAASGGLPSDEPLDLIQGSFALVGDNSYFGFTSPVRGGRYRLEVEPTFGTLQLPVRSSPTTAATSSAGR